MGRSTSLHICQTHVHSNSKRHTFDFQFLLYLHTEPCVCGPSLSLLRLGRKQLRDDGAVREALKSCRSASLLPPVGAEFLRPLTAASVGRDPGAKRQRQKGGGGQTVNIADSRTAGMTLAEESNRSGSSVIDRQPVTPPSPARSCSRGGPSHTSLGSHQRSISAPHWKNWIPITSQRRSQSL